MHPCASMIIILYWLTKIVAGVARYTYLYLRGQTPPTVNYTQGATIGFIHSSGKGLTLAQSRQSLEWGFQAIQSKTGLATPEQRAQWAKYYKHEKGTATDGGGVGGSGYWIPFQDQTHKVTDPSKDSNQEATDLAKRRIDFVNQSRVGEGCDLVVFFIHGGGFVQGHPLQSLDLFKRIMRKTHQHHDLKVGFFSVQYSGDSAGGNLCYSLALKIRDEWSPAFLPGAICSSSPYFPWTDKIQSTLFDVADPDQVDYFVDAYTQQRPEVLASPYYTPFNADTLAGLPNSLIFWGSVEVLACWIQKFVDQARKDGVKVETMTKQDRSHCWFMLDPISTVEDREEAIDAISTFLAQQTRRS
ncbi:hypothetical protein BGZ96_001307 [Linnemannia gamsii]|uniref:Alpha/beta hydrolase fold-3 domain-containing protein n=1 Tax=Linnemannia gamsii TaxID=64522 RepID=A0ABQ7KAL3_9FUNG|nr:hypothetical protein BGZ96_001307 [Linnemannia gamsii]